MGRPRKGTHVRPPPGSPWATPEQEYVEAPNGIGLRELAKKWGCHLRTLARWSIGNAWSTKRQQYWKTVEDRRRAEAAREAAVQAAANAAELEKMRGEAPKRQARIASAIQVAIARRLAIEGTARGTLSISDLRGLASAHEAASGTERRALGLDRPGADTDAPPAPAIRETLLGEPVVVAPVAAPCAGENGADGVIGSSAVVDDGVAHSEADGT